MMTTKDDLQVFKTGRKIGNILGVNVNSTQKNKVLVKVRDLLARKRKFYIVTPNPEIILKALKDKNLLSALNLATISIPDGVGLKLADPSLTIIKGRDLFMSLISLANKKGWRVFLLGGKGDEALKTAEKLKLSYKKIKLEHASGPILNNMAKPISESDIDIQNDVVNRINNFKPRFLFVAFGAPKQEKWVNEWLPKLDIGGAMVVGGTFSYIAGTNKVPPKWMEKAGFEWIWRLLIEPKRLTRILNAVFVFPLKVFLYKIRSSS